MTVLQDSATATTPTETTEVVVIGAGFSGMYAVHRLREEGRDFVCFEAGDGVGGTWYWNRYPGARVDIESMQYSYSFDESIQQDWSWAERFSAQPDLERYANFVADRLDLKSSIRFSSRVSSMTFDESEDRWHIRTEAGAHVICRYVIAATGSLDATNVPDWPGLDTFEGQAHHTSQWPRDGVDLVGKRVGLIGTGSTGIQVAPEMAREAGHPTVFQRTPAFSMPSGNGPMDPAYEQEWKADYPARRRQMADSSGLMLFDAPQHAAVDLTVEQREEILERAWRSKTAFALQVAFTDTAVNPESNEIVAEFVRRKIRETVDDPETAELRRERRDRAVHRRLRTTRPRSRHPRDLRGSPGRRHRRRPRTPRRYPRCLTARCRTLLGVSNSRSEAPAALAKTSR